MSAIFVSHSCLSTIMNSASFFLDVFCSFMVKVLFCDILHTSFLSLLTIEGEAILNWDSNPTLFFEACIMISTDPSSRKTFFRINFLCLYEQVSRSPHMLPTIYFPRFRSIPQLLLSHSSPSLITILSSMAMFLVLTAHILSLTSSFSKGEASS